ncbi:hypothetical protein [Paenibacillus sp. NPDC093718]|uniref:hypothetical protein n=1 Tax=Paenibacillus sp. NPDC093718 TaxID=3390601 RepID=UPI003D000843
MIRERQERSDKKCPAAPYISDSSYEQIARIGYVCDLPLKAVGELLAREGLKSKDLIDVIKLNFRRDFIVDDYQICIGHQENRPFRMNFTGDKKRLAMRFYKFEHERFAALAYALDCSVQMAIGYVIETSLTRKNILLTVLGKGIIRELNQSRIEQLREICRFLDQRSPDVYITLPVVMAHILNSSLIDQKKITKTIAEWTHT